MYFLGKQTTSISIDDNDNYNDKRNDKDNDKDIDNDIDNMENLSSTSSSQLKINNDEIDTSLDILDLDKIDNIEPDISLDIEELK